MKLYGDGTGVRNVKEYFDQVIRTGIFQNVAWGNLSDKQISIVPYDEKRLGLRCVAKIYGKIVEQYETVPL